MAAASAVSAGTVCVQLHVLAIVVLAVVLLPLRRNASAVLGTGWVIFDHS
jgi:hypothetical protein